MTWMDLEIIIRSEVRQTKTNIIWYSLHTESKRMILMGVFTKQKQTQTSRTNLWIVCLTWQCPHESGPGSSLHLNAWTLCWHICCPTHALGLDQLRICISPLTEVICFNHPESWTLALVKFKAENGEQLISPAIYLPGICGRHPHPTTDCDKGCVSQDSATALSADLPRSSINTLEAEASLWPRAWWTHHLLGRCI